MVYNPTVSCSSNVYFRTYWGRPSRGSTINPYHIPNNIARCIRVSTAPLSPRRHFSICSKKEPGHSPPVALWVLLLGSYH